MNLSEYAICTIATRIELIKESFMIISLCPFEQENRWTGNDVVTRIMSRNKHLFGIHLVKLEYESVSGEYVVHWE